MQPLLEHVPWRQTELSLSELVCGDDGAYRPVEALEKGRVPVAVPADEDPGPQNAHSKVSTGPQVALGRELRLLVKVLETLAYIERLFLESVTVIARHVQRGNVEQRQPPRAAEICDVLGGQRVDAVHPRPVFLPQRGERRHVQDAVEWSAARQSPSHAPLDVAEPRLFRAPRLPGQGNHVPTVVKQPRQHLAAEEARTARDEDSHR